MNTMDTEQLFQKMYHENGILPEPLGGKARILSCLSAREGRKVYLLEDSEGRRSILKATQGEEADFLAVEAEALRASKFSFLPKLYGFFEEDEEVFLWREYIEGDTLWEKVERDGAFAPDDAARLLERLCGLVGQFHACEQPLIHRDLKPQNFVLTPEDKLFLIDMETVRKYREGASHDTVFAGTRQNAAPEQYGYSQTDCRTDIYAMGILFLYLLTGSMDLHGREIETLPETYRSVVEKCTRLDPAERFQSCEELRSAVEKAARGLPFTEKKKGVGRKAAAALLALFFLGTAVVFGAWKLRGEDGIYHFQEPLIEQAVRQQLQKESGKIRKEDLERITTLRICGDRILDQSDYYARNVGTYELWTQAGQYVELSDVPGEIRSLEDCAYMKNLDTLILGRETITDLTPLSGLPIRFLSIQGNPVSDLTPLKELPKLQELVIDNTLVSDLSPLASMEGLKLLGLYDIPADDLSPIAGLALESLSIPDASAEDPQLLAGMPLKYLWLPDASEDEILAIGKIGTLEALDLFGYPCASLEPLLGLKELQSLNVCWSNRFLTLEGVDQLVSLESFDFGNTGVSDLTPLAGTEIRHIYVRNTDVQDFSPLKEMPMLEDITCDEQQEATIRGIVSDRPVNVEVADS